MQETVLDGPIEHRLERSKRLGERRWRAATLVDYVGLDPSNMGLGDLHQLDVLAERSLRMSAGVSNAFKAIALQVQTRGVKVVLDKLAKRDLGRLVAADLTRVDTGLLVASLRFGSALRDLADSTDRFGVALAISPEPTQRPVLDSLPVGQFDGSFVELDGDHGLLPD
ncbi:MAG: hypothetical protein KF757_13210 [Phycisphaeraceae bacterium]|nr:hypothetical protein [Phycisphaeraceae bacterium]